MENPASRRGGYVLPYRGRKKSSTGIYHIFVRGINQELIFNQTREKRYFKKIIKKHLDEYEIEIYAYCIMSNHAHFIIKSKDIQKISMFMSKILAEYASYYNYKKKRNGHVFQNRFGSECIENDKYFWNCLRYIHQNPVKAHMVSNPWDYQHSSINDYKKKKNDILHENAIRKYEKTFWGWQEFLEYHYKGNSAVFIGTSKEVYEQQKEIAWSILWEMQNMEKLENPKEVLEEPELRAKYLNEIQMNIQISQRLKKKIYSEIKEELF